MSVEREIGELTGRVGALEKDMSGMAADVKAIRSTLDQAKGGWRTIVIVAGVAGTAGAAIAKIVPWLAVAPK